VALFPALEDRGLVFVEPTLRRAPPGLYLGAPVLKYQSELKHMLRKKKGGRILLREAIYSCRLRMQDTPAVRRTLAIMFGARLVERHGERYFEGVELAGKTTGVKAAEDKMSEEEVLP
jgi:hypothetical protein